MEIGSVVRQFREARDMSQSQLAKALGYSGRSSIAQIERGAIEPSRDKLKKIAQVLNIPVELLLDQPVDENPIASDISPEFLVAATTAKLAVTRGYDRAAFLFGDVTGEDSPGEVYNVADYTTGRVAQFTGSELRGLPPKADALYEAFRKRWNETKAVLPREAYRVGVLYTRADQRDKNLVDTVLAPYDDGTLELPDSGAVEPAEPKTVLFPVAKKKQHLRRGKPMDQLDVFDEPAAAGLGNYLDAPVFRKEQYPHGMIPRGTNFGVLISGDSMEPKIHNAATCFVQSAPRVENGEIGIFVLNGESFCKQLVLKDGQVRLHSFNSAYKDIVIKETDDLRTVGRVIGSYPE